MILRFSSKKEKRLWVSVIVVLAGIYSTLGITESVSNILQSSGLLSPFFMLGMIMVGMTILVYGINKKPNRSTVVVILGILAVYLMVFVRMEIPQERTHLIEYGVVAVLIYQALIERKSKGGWVSNPALIAILGTGIAGLCDELIQSIIPNRVFDPRDILFNILAGIMSVGAVVILNRVNRKKNSTPTPPS